jgi:hypothetical protein
MLNWLFWYENVKCIGNNCHTLILNTNNNSLRTVFYLQCDIFYNLFLFETTCDISAYHHWSCEFHSEKEITVAISKPITYYTHVNSTQVCKIYLKMSKVWFT